MEQNRPNLAKGGRGGSGPPSEPLVFTPHAASNEIKALQVIVKIDTKNENYGLILVKHFLWIYDQNNSLFNAIKNISFDFATKMVDFF